MSTMKVIKKNGKQQSFDKKKIEKALSKANKSVEQQSMLTTEQFEKVMNTIMKRLEGFDVISTETIDDFVEMALTRHNRYAVLKAYEDERSKKNASKEFTPNEEKVLAIIDGDTDMRGDNANKNIDDNASVRDYMAGTLAKSIGRKLISRVSKAIWEGHDKGWWHFHDADYSPVNRMHNCFLGTQKFITDKGIRAFNEFKDGEIVYVCDSENVLRKATVHKYEKQPMIEVVFSLRNGITRTIHCTSNHTWILEDGTRTTNLKQGDRLLANTTYQNTINIETDDDAKYWCYGFILGDGCDTPNKYTRVRLCGAKNQFLENFKKTGGFRFSTQNEDVVPFTKWFSKQNCLSSYGWRMLSARQKALMFLGYYAADGSKSNSRVYVSDDRICTFIEECAGLAGYYITSVTETYHDTNYETNAHGYYYRFLRPQSKNYSWVVKSIKPYDHNYPKETWCIVEPVTHSFMLEGGIPTGNCDLIDVESMLSEKGFVMGNTKIEPHPTTKFRTACNLLSQINLQVSGRQYGGQTQSWTHLLPFVENSRNNYRLEVIKKYDSEESIIKKIRKALAFIGIKTGPYNEKRFNNEVEKLLRREIKEGVKIYQYQVLCHSSSNGQTPFVSNNLCLREAQSEQELHDLAMIIEEIFKRRIQGVQDPSGHWISPLFPKLLYWTCDGLNVKEGDPYFYLTQLAAVCESCRMQPDIMSEKQMRKIKQGQIIPTMGCRSLLAPIWEDTKYPIDTEFYWCDKLYGIEGHYPYSEFRPKCNLKSLENRVYKTGYDGGEILINFRGNTGWLKEKTDDYVIISKPVVYGRWNNGVVTINLPHAALTAVENAKTKGSNIMDEFYKVLDSRLKVMRQALQLRYDYVSKIKGKNSPILWMYGGLSRIGAEDTVGELMKKYPQRASISLGFVGLYETCRALIGQSNTSKEGQKLSIEILKYLNDTCNKWKAEGYCMGEEDIIKGDFELDE